MSVKKEKPAFLTSREWEYILALEKWEGYRGGGARIGGAAQDLGVKVHAIENVLSRIRRKIEDAYTFKRKYGKLIERKR